MSKDLISIREALEYEIKGSWWASWVGNKYLQVLVSKYFAWKVKRKYNRFLLSMMRESENF